MKDVLLCSNWTYQTKLELREGMGKYYINRNSDGSLYSLINCKCWGGSRNDKTSSSVRANTFPKVICNAYNCDSSSGLMMMTVIIIIIIIKIIIILLLSLWNIIMIIMFFSQSNLVTRVWSADIKEGPFQN